MSVADLTNKIDLAIESETLFIIQAITRLIIAGLPLICLLRIIKTSTDFMIVPCTNANFLLVDKLISIDLFQNL